VENRRNIHPILLILVIVLFFWASWLTFFQEKADIQLIAYFDVLRSIFIVIFIFLSSFSLGSSLISFLPFPGRRFREDILLSFAIGLGGISFLCLFLGAFGLLKTPLFGVLLLLIFLSGFPHYKKFFYYFMAWLEGIKKKSFLPVEFCLIAMFCLIICMYFIASLAHSIQYDVLEYHLGSLSQSLRSGSIKPQPHVFYSYLPFGIEALFSSGMILEGELTYLCPKLINFALWLLCAAGLYIFSDMLGLERHWRLSGIVLFGMNRLVFNVGLDAYVELGQTLYVISALICWVKWWKSSGRKEAGIWWIRCSFLFWGLALGAKYSILGIGILPFFMILLPFGLYLKKKEPGKIPGTKYFQELFIIALEGGFILVLLFLPWMIRSFYHTGNPFFPFLSGIFRWDAWTPRQMAFYMQGNRSAAIFSPNHLKIYLSEWKELGALYFLPLFPAFFIFRKKRIISIFAIYILCGYFFWNLFLQPPHRFLVPLIPVLIVIVLFVLRKLMREWKICLILPVLYAFFIIPAYHMHLVELYNQHFIEAAMFSYDQEAFLKEHLGPYKDAADFINNTLPENTKLLFLYEARSMYIKRPVTVNTVFDKSLLVEIADNSKDAASMRANLKKLGYTHILVNEFELNRLIHTYCPIKIEEENSSLAEIFQNPDSNLTAFENLYGPYHFDKRFKKNRNKIRSFMSYLRKNTIFIKGEDRSISFYISPL
jgi:hypothetical protein